MKPSRRGNLEEMLHSPFGKLKKHLTEKGMTSGTFWCCITETV